jgi:hypothetical protein
LQCSGCVWEILLLGARALHGSPMGDPFKNRKPMGSNGYPLGKLQISLLKPNTQRQDAYHLKAHPFLHWFL